MNFTFIDLEHIFEKGLAKSRTLRSCHFIGLNTHRDKYHELIKYLKVKENQQDDFCAKLDKEKLQALFEKKQTVADASEYFAEKLKEPKMT